MSERVCRVVWAHGWGGPGLPLPPALPLPRGCPLQPCPPCRPRAFLPGDPAPAVPGPVSPSGSSAWGTGWGGCSSDVPAALRDGSFSVSWLPAEGWGVEMGSGRGGGTPNRRGLAPVERRWQAAASLTVGSGCQAGRGQADRGPQDPALGRPHPPPAELRAPRGWGWPPTGCPGWGELAWEVLALPERLQDAAGAQGSPPPPLPRPPALSPSPLFCPSAPHSFPSPSPQPRRV